MLKINKMARPLAALAVCGALALPALAQDKMSSSKMSGGKTMSKMAADKMMMGKMMGMMSATDKKTYMAMTASEKSLCMKMCMKPMSGMSSSKMSGKM